MRTIALAYLVFLISLTSAYARSGVPELLKKDGYNWKVIESEQFAVYFDEGSIDGARQCLKFASENLKKIETKVGFPLSGRIEIIYYNSLYDLNRSFQNYKSKYEDINTGGVTGMGNNIFPVYRSALSSDLMIQVKRGIASILVNDMIFEGTVQEKIKYGALLHLPDWFVAGLTEYLAAGWDEKSDDQLKAAFQMDAFRNMNLISQEDEILAGKSIWKFIDERKGDLTIPRILYLVRLTRKVESAVYFVFNWSMKDLFREWETYYRGIYSQDSRRRLPMGEEAVNTDFMKGQISGLKFSPNGEKMAFLYFDGDKYQLVVYDRSVVRKSRSELGWTNRLPGSTDRYAPEQVWYELRTFPENGIYDPYRMVFEWKDSETLYLLLGTHRATALYEIGPKGGKRTVEILELENVRDLAYDGGHNMLISASGVHGQAIFLYDPAKKELDPVLDDTADYLEPTFDQNGLGFYFTRSERLIKDIYGRQWNRDIAYYSFVDDSVTWIANDQRYDEFSALRYGKNAISFLSDENGIRNAYLFDGKNIVGLTDYQHNIMAQSNTRDASLVVELLNYNGRNHLFVSEFVADIEELSTLIYAAPTYFASRRYRKSDEVTTDSVMVHDEESSVVDEIKFQTDFPYDDIDSILAVHKYNTNQKEILEIRDHRLKWVPSQVVVQLHNGMLNTDRFAAYRVPQASFTNPFSVHAAVTMESVHKNKVLTGGIKTNTNFYRLEMYGNYENRKNHLIRTVNVWRKSSVTSTDDQVYFKNLSGDASARVAYPIRNHILLAGGVGFRRDKRIFLSSSTESLQTNSLEQRLARMEVSVILDRIKNDHVNVYEGFHLSLKTEYQVSLMGAGDFGASRFNARYAKKIAPLLYWHNHIEANNSYGTGQMRYFIGGMENWIDPGIKLNPYLVSELTTYFVPVFGVRGFQYNARNGNTSVTFTSELRYELGKRMVKRSGQSEILENLMVAGFFDMGSAWYGRSPYDRINPLNSRVIETGAMRITVYNPKDPLIYGLGGGLRTSVFTYYLKWDVAVGRDNGEWLKKMHYITIGKDF